MTSVESQLERHLARHLLLSVPLAVALLLLPLLGFLGLVSADEEPPVFLRQWAEYGSGVGEFNQPFGVSVDSDSNVFVADRMNHRIQRFDGTAWSVIGGDGSAGIDPGQFNTPMGVAVSPVNGDVYVADMANHRIQRFDGADWTVIGGDGVVGTDPGEFNAPRGIAVQTDGNVYVADVGNHRVQMFDGSDWSVIGGDGSPGSDPGEFNYPARVCVGGGGKVYVADSENHRVQSFDGVEWTIFAGTGSASSAEGEFSSPTGVAVDATGNVYVAEKGNNRIQEFDSTGAFLTTWGGNGSEPGQFAAANDVAVGPDGDIYVADTCPMEGCNHRIQVFTYRDVALLALALEAGWNMVSVPVVGEDMSVDAVFHDAEAVYTWNPATKSYQSPTTIEPEKSYWVAVTSTTTVTMTGTPVTEWTDTLTAGWNMAGSVYGDPVDVEDITDDLPGTVQTNAIYHWNPLTKSYDVATQVKEGLGYWMAATDSCTLSVAQGATEAAIHTQAWTDAAEQCAESEYCKCSLYSTRTLAVANPEVYLQADALWMDMISTYGGWQANYLQRDRETPEGGWNEEIGTPINDGFRNETGDGAFDWGAVEWESHRAAVTDLFSLYDDAFTFDWLDNRLLFIWSALKGEGWAMPESSLAELMYLDMLRQETSAYLLFQEDRDALVATVVDTTVTLYDPATGETIDEPYSEVVLVMNNDHVWYPLMARDDTSADIGLASVVDEFCIPGAIPSLAPAEDSVISRLATGTALQTEADFTWAKLFAMRAVNQYGWRTRPLRELSAGVLPERYAEDSGYSDSPCEQVALGMVVTEMGNRLSPLSSMWAAGVRARSGDMDAAFEYVGDDYHDRFHRTDEDDEWVYGDYYHCWQPNIEDKLISGLGNCVVEACNTIPALYLAGVPDWDVLLTNWWSLGSTGGHVICGAYGADEALSLSNGLFRTSDGYCTHGPLWNVNGTVAEEVIYEPSTGFMTFVQTVNAASFSEFATPFTNLPFSAGSSLLEDVEGFEPGTLIAQEYGGESGISVGDYVDSLPGMEADWPDNVFAWEWPQQ